MAPFFANQSCDPFTPADTPCTLGNYVRYAINVSNADDAIAGISFAKEKNVRLVIRNTGHDYLGKSTGAGSLALWTHHVKGIEIIDYSGPFYGGKAIKVGAGIQAEEAAEVVEAQGLVSIAGNCPTVGIADLYWALAGGGGSTYGVVLSMTAKLYEDVPVTGATIAFSSQNVTTDTYWAAIHKWPEFFSPLLDEGISANSYIMNTSFAIAPITAVGKRESELSSRIEPYLTYLNASGIQYQKSVVEYPGYYPQHRNMTPPQQVANAQLGGWMIPRTVVKEQNDELTAAWRKVVDDGAVLINLHYRPSKEVAGDVYNAVLPAWREIDLISVFGTPWNYSAPWSEMVADQRKITNEYVPLFSALAPESGAYLNEADFNQPNWQTAFYGKNYDRLREIKSKYDPDDVFYATTAVGSDEWQVSNDGRLCKK
ncbi:hypothetical protein SLS57_001679 [Botryosphaeria dothidea]